MKQNLYKIIAIVSVMLGALGPQVASGQTLNTPQNTIDQASTSYSISVISAPAVPVAIVSHVSVGKTCSTDAELASPNQLLWQGCGSLAIAQDQQLPKLAVVSQPNFVPQLAVQTAGAVTVSVSLNPVASRENLVLPILGLGLKTPGTSTTSRLITINQKTSNKLSKDTQNNFKTIVMQC